MIVLGVTSSRGPLTQRHAKINTGEFMVRVVLPPHLRALARINHEVVLDVNGPVTIRSVLDALESSYPMLCGTIRDHVTQQRRPFLRFFACSEDFSHESPDAPLPEPVSTGAEPLLVVGAIAGG
jgi:sulfur-carrier protein